MRPKTKHFSLGGASSALVALLGCMPGQDGRPCAPVDPLRPEQVPVDQKLPKPSAAKQAPATAKYDPCDTKHCGETCRLCDPADVDCVETAVVKACNDAGQCVAAPAGECNAITEARNNPCSSLECGAPCQVCPPGDSKCDRKPLTCNALGQCTADPPSCEARTAMQ
jgi:hypothetical protein